MKYRVKLKNNEDTRSAVPGLPGCWSQGATEAEALENIADAIATYMATVEELRAHPGPGKWYCAWSGVSPQLLNCRHVGRNGVRPSPRLAWDQHPGDPGRRPRTPRLFSRA